MGKDASGVNVRPPWIGSPADVVEAGDVVVVMMETYVLNSQRGEGIETRLVVSNRQPGDDLARTTILAEDVGKALESLVRRGCKVILVLDGTHESPVPKTDSSATEWARSLRNQHDVITVLATTRKPIADVHVETLRPLARSILDSIRSANPRPADPLMTYDDFRGAIVQRVQELTKRTAEPMLYLPRGFEAGAPILTRKP